MVGQKQAVKGGQGREASAVESDGWALVFWSVVAVMIFAVVVIAGAVS